MFDMKWNSGEADILFPSAGDEFNNKNLASWPALRIEVFTYHVKMYELVSKEKFKKIL